MLLEIRRDSPFGDIQMLHALERVWDACGRYERYMLSVLTIRDRWDIAKHGILVDTAFSRLEL